MYRSCFITDSALMLNAHTLISFYDKVKKPQHLLGSMYAVQFQIALVIIGMEGLGSHRIPKSCLLLPVTSFFTQILNLGFML